MSDFQAEGGGVHPGKPIIWPTGKSSSSPTSSSPQSQTTGSVKNVPTQATPTVAPTEAPKTTAPATPATPAPAAPTVARALTVEDVRAHLLSIQIEPNDFNVKLASLMLRNGVELSRANLVKIMTMLQGSDKSQAMQEASVLLLMKGIDSPQAAKILGQYFAENPGLASQFAALQEGVGNLTSALGMGQALLDANLIAQLSSVLSQFDQSVRNLSEKAAGKPSMNRENLITDVRALKALLQGAQNKAPVSDSAGAQALSSSMMECQSKLDGIMQNLLAQSILSQSGREEVNYLYHQIPNAMTNPPKDLEIMVKREGEGKGAPVDPRNTQVVMSMETTNMGKMVISMYVKDNKVYVIFVFAAKDTGEQGRGLIAKEFGDFQQKLADKNYMITGYQVKVDPAMVSIKPYLIPMLPSLESILKKIDIEA
ncbi:MAG: hypothetical protein PHH60_02795 [Candidatus Margulisbacteria bacterium]|nr:hypothetical protein [Candidatus Margulisiibacteriota bacterium]